MRLPGRLFLGNLVQRRTLLFQMVRRDFEKRFVGSAAGWLWGVVHPLVLLASWTFVFDVCLKMKLGPEEVTDNYTLFLFCGFLPWLLFQDTVQRSSMCLLENANLITKTIFPSEIVPISIFLSSLIHHLIGLALVVAAVAIWLNRISVMLVFLPVYLVLIGLLAVGLGWIFAALQVYLRDTAQMLVVIMTLWFWVTPIFITEAQYPSWALVLIKANPMAHVVRAYRDRILSPNLPDPKELVVLAAYSAAAFVLGGLFFRQLKKGFADVL
ncbi:MAG TPA: ABC transporter permease [Bryobacteraceae bacterium]|nr:ABC transporter permease [Bryobacteraceae bacterium]